MTNSRRRFACSLIALTCVLTLGNASAADQATDRYITVASTTSTENSGLFSYLLPIFQAKTGIAVRVVALGTGQALDVGRRGDADVVFVHDKPAEEKFVAEGSGVARQEVMYNDFVLIGPTTDPAKVAGGKDIAAALKAVQTAQAPFVSRSDQQRHSHGRAAAVECCRCRHRCEQGPVVSRDGLRQGRRSIRPRR